jgi:hypothetical protein
MKMKKEIVSVMVLLAFCIPALAIDMPDMVGNWTGILSGVAWLKNTNYQASGEAEYYEGEYTLAIEEQNGTRFAGKIIRAANPLASEVVLGVIGSDNQTIAMVNEDGYMWGWMNSSTEMELSSQSVDMDQMTVREGILTKE